MRPPSATSSARACRLRAGVRVDAFRGNGGVGRRIVRSRGGNGRRGDGGGGGQTAVRHPPNAPALVVRYIKCAVRSEGEARRAVYGLTGLFHGAGESVGEYH